MLEFGFVKDKVEKKFTFEFSSRCTKGIMYLFLDKKKYKIENLQIYMENSYQNLPMK